MFVGLLLKKEHEIKTVDVGWIVFSVQLLHISYLPHVVCIPILVFLSFLQAKCHFDGKLSNSRRLCPNYIPERDVVIHLGTLLYLFTFLLL
jgi:hypothetical protein